MAEEDAVFGTQAEAAVVCALVGTIVVNLPPAICCKMNRSSEPGHVAVLGHDRIHHFEYEPHRDGDGLKHGMYILRTQLVIHGNEIHYLPLMHQPSPDRTPNASERRSARTR